MLNHEHLLASTVPFQYLYLISPSFVQELEGEYIFFSFYHFVAGVRNIHKPSYSFPVQDQVTRSHPAVVGGTNEFKVFLKIYFYYYSKLLPCLTVQELPSEELLIFLQYWKWLTFETFCAPSCHFTPHR